MFLKPTRFINKRRFFFTRVYLHFLYHLPFFLSLSRLIMVMGEAAQCLVRSFSQPSSTFCDFKEGDPLRALTTSISFGRFMTEPLDWEKWSSFSHNRTLEDVKKYSKPGSVAEKKAFFEAHYKKIAAKKAAKSSKTENEEPNYSPKRNVTTYNSPTSTSDCSKSATDDTRGKESLTPSTNLGSTCTDNVDKNMSCIDHVGHEEASTEDVYSENHRISVEMSNQLQHLDNDIQEQEENTYVKDAASNGDKVALNKLKPASSSTKSSRKNGAYKLRSRGNPPPPPPIFPKKEEIATLNSRKAARDVKEKKRLAPQSIHMSMNFLPARKSSYTRSSPFVNKNENLKNVKPIAAKDRLTQQAPNRMSVNVVTKYTQILPRPENKRPKTLLDGSVIGSSKTAVVKSSISTNFSESTSASIKKPKSATVPSSFSFRSEERATKRKEFFKKLEEKANMKDTEKIQPQPKLKEKAGNDQKKLRRSTVLKAKPSTNESKEPINNMKEKAGNDQKMLCQSTVLGAKPNSNDTEEPSNNMKVPPTQPRTPRMGRKPIPSPPRTPRMGRKPIPSPVQDTCYQPPWRSSLKPKNVVEMNKKKLSSSVASLPTKKIRENASPNVQPLV